MGEWRGEWEWEGKVEGEGPIGWMEVGGGGIVERTKITTQERNLGEEEENGGCLDLDGED
jgi:hypothetical protein